MTASVLLALSSPLQEVDISVRRRALDLLYRMCDKDTAREIIEELLDYLGTADVAIKDELVLKIAILAERFLTGTKLYIDVILQLVSIAGDYVSDEIWFRVVKVKRNNFFLFACENHNKQNKTKQKKFSLQIVVNREEIQEYAAKAVLKALKVEPWHETMVKIGGYILGEFGHLIAESPGCSPHDQFKVLHARYGMVGVSTKALLLSTYAKFVNVFPDTAKTMREVFEAHRDNIDAEVQQRACEYLALTVPDARTVAELMQVVLDAIPPWDEAKAAAARDAGEDARAEKEEKAEKERDEARAKQAAAAAAGSAAMTGGATSSTWTAASQQQQSILDLLTGGAPPATTTTMTSIPPQVSMPSAPLVPVAAIPSVAVAPQPASMTAASMAAAPPPSAAATVSTAQGPTQLSDDARSRVKANWVQLCIANEGVLFQDDTVQVGVKGEYQGSSGRIVFFYGNLTTMPVLSLTTSFTSLPQLTVQATVLSQNIIGPKAQLQQPVHLTCSGEFNDIAILRVGYVQPPRAPVTLELPLPVVLSKFLSPPAQRQLAAPEFVAQWKALSGPGLELQQVFRAKSPINIPALRSMLSDGLKVSVLERVDPKETNLVVAGILHTSQRDVRSLSFPSLSSSDSHQ